MSEIKTRDNTNDIKDAKETELIMGTTKGIAILEISLSIISKTKYRLAGSPVIPVPRRLRQEGSGQPGYTVSPCLKQTSQQTKKLLKHPMTT